MDGFERPEGEVAPEGDARGEKVLPRPLPESAQIHGWCRACSRRRRAERLICGKSHGRWAHSGRSSGECDPHSCSAPGRWPKNDLHAVFAHGPQNCWPYESSPPHTGGCVRSAAPEAQQLQLKTRSVVEASSMRLGGEDAQGRGLAGGGVKGKDLP